MDRWHQTEMRATVLGAVVVEASEVGVLGRLWLSVSGGDSRW